MPRQLDQLGLFDFTSLCPVCTKPIFKFRDAVKELNANHPQRGSVLVNAIISEDRSFVNGMLTDEDEQVAQQKLDQDIANYVDPKIITAHERKN